MASRQQVRSELDSRARQGETVIPGGTGGKSIEAQEHLAEGNLFVFALILFILSSMHPYSIDKIKWIIIVSHNIFYIIVKNVLHHSKIINIYNLEFVIVDVHNL